MVWQSAIALVFVALHGCQNLEERSFILLTLWKKNTQVSAREANLILQALAFCTIYIQFPSSQFAVWTGAERFRVLSRSLSLPPRLCLNEAHFPVFVCVTLFCVDRSSELNCRCSGWMILAWCNVPTITWKAPVVIKHRLIVRSFRNLMLTRYCKLLATHDLSSVWTEQCKYAAEKSE